MRKIIIAVLVLVILGSATAFLVYRYKQKPLPTPIGWKAHVTTIAGDGSPLVRDGKQSAFSDPFGVASLMTERSTSQMRVRVIAFVRFRLTETSLRSRAEQRGFCGRRRSVRFVQHAVRTGARARRKSLRRRHRKQSHSQDHSRRERSQLLPATEKQVMSMAQRPRRSSTDQ